MKKKTNEQGQGHWSPHEDTGLAKLSKLKGSSSCWKEAERSRPTHTTASKQLRTIFTKQKFGKIDLWRKKKKKNCIVRGKDMVIQRVFFIFNYHDLSWTCPQTSREERVLTLTWGHGSLGIWMHNCSRKDHLTSQECRVTVHRARISPVGYLLFCF